MRRETRQVLPLLAGFSAKPRSLPLPARISRQPMATSGGLKASADLGQLIKGFFIRLPLMRWQRVVVHALEQIFGRPVGNVFVKARAGLLLREQKCAVSVWELGHVQSVWVSKW